jgi:hypothetical protein
VTSAADRTPIATALAWLLSPHDVEPVPERWVPGAPVAERSRLTALGGLVNALVGTAVADGPGEAFAEPDLRAWLAGGPQPPKDVIVAGKRVLAEDMEDGLARIYASVVSSASRRTLGTFLRPHPG